MQAFPCVSQKAMLFDAFVQGCGDVWFGADEKKKIFNVSDNRSEIRTRLIFRLTKSDTLPTNSISIEFEIRSRFAMLWFKMYSLDHNNILHTSRQCYCRDVCNILLWSAAYVMNKSVTNFHWFSNSIEIPLAGMAAGQNNAIGMHAWWFRDVETLSALPALCEGIQWSQVVFPREYK